MTLQAVKQKIAIQNGLITKNKVNFKRMTLQPLKQKMAIHVLPDISRNKGNQTIRFGQLIKYKTRNNFLENNTQNVVEKLQYSQNLFSKIEINHISGSLD